MFSVLFDLFLLSVGLLGRNFLDMLLASFQGLNCAEFLLPLEPELSQLRLSFLQEVQGALKEGPQGFLVIRECPDQLDVVHPGHHGGCVVFEVVLHEFDHLRLVLDLVGFDLSPGEPQLIQVGSERCLLVRVELLQVINRVSIHTPDDLHLLGEGGTVVRDIQLADIVLAQGFKDVELEGEVVPCLVDGLDCC